MTSSARHGGVLSSAAFLLASTIVTAGLGLAFWALAARQLDMSAVGRATSGAAAMTFISLVGSLGFGTSLLRHLAKDLATGRRLLSAALVTTVAATSLLSLVFVGAARAVSSEMRILYGAPSTVVCFVLGGAATAAGLVLDQAMLGTAASRLQWHRSIYVSIAKVGLLVGLVALLPDATGALTLDCWGMAATISLMSLVAHRSARAVLVRPDFRGLRALSAESSDHNITNLALQLPALVLPLIVVLVLSPAVNAAFYAAWMIATLLLLIPAHVTTALFASVAADTAELAQRVRFTLTACLAIGVPAVVATIALAGPLLRPLGPGYAANGAICLRILVLAYVPFTIKMHAVAIARAQQRLRSTSRWLALAAVVEAGAAAVAAEMWGVNGLAAAIAIAFCVEGIVCLPMVWHLVGRRAQPRPVSLLGTRIPQPLHRQIRDTGPGAMNGVSRLVP